LGRIIRPPVARSTSAVSTSDGFSSAFTISMARRVAAASSG
jgi:hypothetical protein